MNLDEAERRIKALEREVAGLKRRLFDISMPTKRVDAIGKPLPGKAETIIPVVLD